MHPFRPIVALGFSLILASACGGGGGAGTGAAAGKSALDPSVVAKANEIFVGRCTPCHGVDGRGDGTASATLNPKPRNFHDEAWQKSVTDDHIMKIIKMGGAAVGKSAAMPSNPDITSSQVLTGLKEKVRSFAGK
ncbi:MAG: c-type cytochrome [Myxococcota bacterium]